MTLEDGIDSMDASTVSDDHAVSIEPLVADQIEIFRGLMMLLYGSGAIGGIINTVTTRIPEASPADGFAGAFELRGDSVASDRAGALRLDGGGDQFAWHFDGLTRDSDDYEIPGFADVDHAEEVAGADPGDEVPGIVAQQCRGKLMPRPSADRGSARTVSLGFQSARSTPSTGSRSPSRGSRARLDRGGAALCGSTSTRRA